MKVALTTAIAMFLEMGVKTATKWDKERAHKRILALPETLKGEETPKLKTAESQKLLKDVLAALKAEKDIEIVDEIEDAGNVEKPSKKKATTKAAAEEKETAAPKKAAKKKAAASDDAEAAAEEKETAAPKKAAKKKAAPKQKKVGPVATIIECLKAATKDEPTTVDKIVKVLVKRFPEREEKGMRNTVKGCYFWMPFEQGLIVKRDDEGGMWVAGECPKGTRPTDLDKKATKKAAKK